MIKTIWIMWKPGEERIYTMAIQPSEPWATTQKENGYNIVSLDVELPDPTVSSTVVVGDLKLLHYNRVALEQCTHIADQVAESAASGWREGPIESFTYEEAALKRPGYVLPVKNSGDGLVALCGEIHLHRDGGLWLKGRKIAQVTESKPAPGYDILVEFCSDDLLEQIRKLTVWWFASFCRAKLE